MINEIHLTLRTTNFWWKRLWQASSINCEYTSMWNPLLKTCVFSGLSTAPGINASNIIFPRWVKFISSILVNNFSFPHRLFHSFDPLQTCTCFIPSYRVIIKNQLCLLSCPILLKYERRADYFQSVLTKLKFYSLPCLLIHYATPPTQTLAVHLTKSISAASVTTSNTLNYKL